MELKIVEPGDLDPELLKKLVSLIDEGGQIGDPERIQARILNADFVALYLDNGNIVTTATLKNPIENYKHAVFKNADSKGSAADYTKELGYIATSKEYEGKGYCKKLLAEIKPKVAEHKVFATTRKASMAHILTTNGFKKDGNVYKEDLELYLLT